jgi:hypothetical protein
LNTSLPNGAKSICKILQQIQFFKKPEYLKTGILRSVTSMTEHHLNLATGIHEQNVENYLQHWDVQEYAFARCPDESMDKFQGFDKHIITSL